MSILASMFQDLRDYPEALIAYQDDFLNHDIVKIRAAKPGDLFVWIVRDHGTHIHVVGNNPDYIKAVLSGEGVKFIRLILITHIYDALPPDGYITRYNKAETITLIDRKFAESQALKESGNVLPF